MDAIEVAGETVEVTGPFAARVKSGSQAGVWYAVDLESGSCTCKGFQVRKRCRHLSVVREFMEGEDGEG